MRDLIDFVLAIAIALCVFFAIGSFYENPDARLERMYNTCLKRFDADRCIKFLKEIRTKKPEEIPDVSRLN